MAKTHRRSEMEKRKSLCGAPLSVLFKALITDIFLILMPILYGVIYLLFHSREAFEQHRLLGWGVIIALHILITVAVFATKKQTPGMKLYGLRLVNSQDGSAPSIFKIGMRTLLFWVTFFSFFGWFVPFFNKAHRSLHDILARTCMHYEG